MVRQRERGGMNELWVARDGDETLHVYRDREPDWVPATKWTMGEFHARKWVSKIDSDLFPNLKPGECKRLVLAEESSK